MVVIMIRSGLFIMMTLSFYHRLFTDYLVNIYYSHIRATTIIKSIDSLASEENTQEKVGRRLLISKQSKYAKMKATPPKQKHVFAALALIVLLIYEIVYDVKERLMTSKSKSTRNRSNLDIDNKDSNKRQILNYCLRHRGTNGRWVVNETFGRETFYATGFRSNKWRRQNINNLSNAVYPGNKFYLVDDTATATAVAVASATATATSTTAAANGVSEAATVCPPILPATKSFFDDVIRQKLKIERIMFVGDSLTQLQFGSLLLSTGAVTRGAIVLGPYKHRQLFVDTDIECGSSGSNGNITTTSTNTTCRHTLEYVAARENLGPNFGYTLLNRSEFFNRSEYNAYNQQVSTMTTTVLFCSFRHAIFHFLTYL